MAELFNSSTEEPEISPKTMKREKSMAKLEALREKTKLVREQQAGIAFKDSQVKISQRLLYFFKCLQLNFIFSSNNPTQWKKLWSVTQIRHQTTPVQLELPQHLLII